MTAAPRSLSDFGSVSRSQEKHRELPVKYYSNSHFDEATAYRMWFRDMLWRAFPARSDAERAAKAAKVLNVSERQVRNWLRCENDPTLRYVMPVISIAGAEIVLRKIEGEQ